MNLSKRVSQLNPSPTLSITAKVNELKRQGEDVLGLGAGEPDFNTPEHIIDAAVEAMNAGHTKYTASGGIVELKQAICDKLKNDNGLTYAPEQVMVSNGAKHALYNVFQAMIDPGEEVIVPIPYWVSYPEQVKLAGGNPIFIEGREENEFKITPSQLKAVITEKTRAIILNSPSNPTGSVYSSDELKALAQVCIQNDIFMVSDEIYEKLIYDGGEHVSVASLGEQEYAYSIVVNGVSKPYSMTGWRIGYVAGNKDLIKAMATLSSQSTSNPVTFAQYGALQALQGTQEPLKKMKEAFVERRNRIVSLLNDIEGISCIRPKGAFYVFANVSEAVRKGGYDSVNAWAEALLESEKVAVVPGNGFGSSEHIRISYATSMDVLEESSERIRRFVEQS